MPSRKPHDADETREPPPPPVLGALRVTRMGEGSWPYLGTLAAGTGRLSSKHSKKVILLNARLGLAALIPPPFLRAWASSFWGDAVEARERDSRSRASPFNDLLPFILRVADADPDADA